MRFFSAVYSECKLPDIKQNRYISSKKHSKYLQQIVNARVYDKKACIFYRSVSSSHI